MARCSINECALCDEVLFKVTTQTDRHAVVINISNERVMNIFILFSKTSKLLIQMKLLIIHLQIQSTELWRQFFLFAFAWLAKFVGFCLLKSVDNV